ncbi:unnamed protein product [Linum tenue]|uniref:Uncharacterized protein n=1 Tax=Linum tenue TaxID=586396 RepID=A0AAV0RMB5_9ROSI|nr:unnamed protein product [Linum tenue]
MALVEKGLGQVAAKVNRALDGKAGEELIEALETWIENPHISVMGVATKGMLWLGSSPRYDFYGNLWSLYPTQN